MDEQRLKKQIREYHSFKNTFDILVWRLKLGFKKMSVEKIKNEIPILLRLFAEAKKCLDCINAEVTDEEREKIHWRTIKNKWDRRFDKPWKEFLEKWLPRLPR